MERIYVNDVLVETVETRILKWRYGVSTRKLALRRAQSHTTSLVERLVCWGIISVPSIDKEIDVMGVEHRIDIHGRLVRSEDFGKCGDAFVRSYGLAVALANVAATYHCRNQSLYGNGPFGKGYYDVADGVVTHYQVMNISLDHEAYERKPDRLVAMHGSLYTVSGALVMGKFSDWNVGKHGTLSE